jgi:hypothetical protein
MLASKWLVALNTEPNTWYFSVYYVCFVICVLTALSSAQRVLHSGFACSVPLYRQRFR